LSPILGRLGLDGQTLIGGVLKSASCRKFVFCFYERFCRSSYLTSFIRNFLIKHCFVWSLTNK